MSPEESIYLDNIRLYAFGKIQDRTNVYISSSCSVQFNEALSRMIGLKANITDGHEIPLGSKKYGLIIDHKKGKFSIGYVAKYKNNLLANGFIAIGAYNHEFIQSKDGELKQEYRLNKKTDRIVSKHRLHPVFREPIGKFMRLNTLPDNSSLNKALAKVGKFFPNSRLYSPFTILIYQLGDSELAVKPYRSATSLRSRLYRICTRQTTLRKIHDFLRTIMFTFYYAHKFRAKIVPTIPAYSPQKGKKVLVIAMQFFGMGGVERVMLHIIKGTNRQLFTIHVITTLPHTNIWHNEFQKYTDYITHVPEILDEDWLQVFRQKYVERYVSNNHADILFITNSDAAYRSLPFIKKSLPDIKVYDLLHTHATPREKDAFLRTSIPFDKYIDKRIVIDQYLKKYYADKYPVDENKISVIYNGIEISSPKKADKKDDALFDSIPENRKKVVFMGRLDEDKSPMRLVDIAIELKKRKLPISIIVVGDGALNEAMINKAISSKVKNTYIYFYGSTNNPLLLDELSDFTLLVSDAEGIPMSILEAMSVSTPAISTEVGGIPEIIDNRADGFLVPILSLHSEDAKITALTDVIAETCSMSDYEYKSMQAAAKQKIVSKFSNMPEIYEHLFETGEILNEEK